MARWRLTAAHYLNVPGTEWEYKETDRETGRQARKVFEVPEHLPEGTVVCLKERTQPTDVIFLGDPTPDMEPLDEEAEAISASHRQRWEHPIESLPAQGLSAGERAFVDTFAQQITNALGAKNTSAGVDPEAFAALQRQVEALMARNAELESEAPAKRRA